MSPTPVSEHQLCQFVSSLANEGLKYSSIKCYLSVVRHLHLEKKLSDPNKGSMARLEQVLWGVKSVQSKQSPPPKPRLPITHDILLKLKKCGTRIHPTQTISCCGQRFAWDFSAL